MDQFPITLISNVGSFHDNTMASFRTLLPRCFNLNGEWRVALKEFSYTKSWYNITNNQKISLFNKNGIIQNTTVEIKCGNYKDASALVYIINSELSKCANYVKQLPKLAIASYTDKLIIIAGKDLQNGLVYPMIDQELEAMLGFVSDDKKFETGDNYVSLSLLANETKVGIKEAFQPIDMKAGIRKLLVYCDIVDLNVIGDTESQYLAPVHISNKLNFGDDDVITDPNPVFKKLITNEFQTIKINIKDDSGNDVPFQYGRVMVTLLFQQWKSSI